MKTNRLTALAVAVALASSAHAVETFSMPYSGSLSHFMTWGECPTCTEPTLSPAQQWSGVVDVTTASSADGVYTGGALTIRIDGTLLDFHELPVSATVHNDKIVSIDGATVPWPLWTFSALTLSYADDGDRHYGQTIGRATLVSAVPEPAEWALLLAGVVVIARRRA